MKSLKKAFLISIPVYLCTLFFAFAAMAQDAGVSATPPYDPDNPVAGISPFLEALLHKQWWAVLAFAVTVAIWGLRKLANKVDWLKSRTGGWILNVGTNLLVYLIPFFAGGGGSLEAFGVVLLGAFKGLAASGILWQIFSDAKKAKEGA